MPNERVRIATRPFLVAFALVFPAFVMAAALIWQSYRNERDSVANALLSTGRAVAAVLDATLDRWNTLLRGLSASAALAGDDLVAFDGIARRAMEGQAGCWLVLLDPTGQQLINTGVSKGSPLPRVEFEAGLLAAMQRGETYVSRLRRSRATGAAVLHISRPYFRDGALAYVMSVTLLPESLDAVLGMQRYDPNYVIAVVDAAGTIIARNREREKFVGREATPDVVRASARGKEATWDSTTIDGTQVVAAFCRAQCGWSAVIGAPKAELLASATRLLILGASCLMLVTAVAGAMAVAMRRALRAEAELKIARDRIREHATELERSVEERTASLRQAVTQLEEFSYTVSHDLRAPIRNMSVFATVLMDDYGHQLDENAQNYLRRIVKAGERMERLTTELLNYSRLGRTEIVQQQVDVDATVASIIAHNPQLQAPRADVTVESPLLPVLGHPQMLEHALTNLLINAAKFVRPGERPRIVVRTELNGPMVRISVEDQGIGIPPKYQHKLFRVFERLPQETAYEGTGVGLAIVRQAAEKMDGRCGVESDGTNGSRFWIELKHARTA